MSDYQSRKARPKMSREQRAKQFLPFAAVSGLDEALQKKEKEYFQKPEPILAEDYLELLDYEKKS